MPWDFAIAERHLNARFGDDLVNHKTYVLAGDGCLMEGISQEAIALAGHLKLKNLIVLWDDNGITIDGIVGMSDSTDQLARFAASGWAVSRVDGHNPDEIAAALQASPIVGSPGDDRLQNHHRLRRAEKAGHQQCPRLAPRRRRNRRRQKAIGLGLPAL